MLQNEIPIYEHELFEHYRLIGWSMLDWKKSLGAWACRLIQQLLGLPVLIVELGLHASNAFLLGLGCHRRGEQTSFIYIYYLKLEKHLTPTCVFQTYMLSRLALIIASRSCTVLGGSPHWESRRPIPCFKVLLLHWRDNMTRYTWKAYGQRFRKLKNPAVRNLWWNRFVTLFGFAAVLWKFAAVLWKFAAFLHSGFRSFFLKTYEQVKQNIYVLAAFSKWVTVQASPLRVCWCSTSVALINESWEVWVGVWTLTIYICTASPKKTI